jgi:hypothetical protein
VHLRRDQTGAVEEILSDLRADPERHLGVLHHLDQHLGRLIGSHDQSFSGSPPDLGGSAAVLVEDDSSGLGFALAPAAVGSRGVTPDDCVRQQLPALLRM